MKQGFTLVELAIVLVIIGLIVGSVLSGRDLIKAAEVKAAVSELGSYNAAAVVFRNKFGGLPGDLTAQRASHYGLSARSGAIGHGDGSRTIEGCAARSPVLGCESALFWIDLTSSRLIGKDFILANALVNGNGVAGSVATTDDMKRYLPSLSLRDTALVHVFPLFDKNHFLIASTYTNASGELQFFSQGGLSPIEAQLIDEKVDDGLPQSGIMKAISALAVDGTGTTINAGVSPAAEGECVNAALSPAKYNLINDDFSTNLTCNVQLMTSF